MDSSDARLRRPDALVSGGTPLPLSWVSLGDSGRLVVQAPAIFLDLTLGSPSPFGTVDFFLGRLFGLGLVGRVCASVPTFFWWYSPSLVLGFAW